MEEIITFTEDQPATRIVGDLITVATQRDISTLNISLGEENAVASYLKNGSTETLAVIPSSVYREVVDRLKVLAGLEISKQGELQEGSFDTEINGRKIYIDVSITPDQVGEKVVLRFK